MFFKQRVKFAKALHSWRCRQVAETPPLWIRPAPLLFLSMVSSADVTMYLVAIKSVYRRIGEGTIVIIDDGSLTEEDRRLLDDHLGGPRFLHIRDIDTGPCPRGGTWERLLMILDLSDDAYVIQVDSDILAVAEMPEVVAAYRDNRAFTLGTRMGQQIVSLRQSAALIASSTGAHVQVTAERIFDELPEPDAGRYVRGCSGFAGFARGGMDRRRLEAFSLEVSSRIGQKWEEWGSEQVASNYVVANSADAVVLPYPKYASFDLDMDPSGSALLHFISPNRFDQDVYTTKSQEAIMGPLRGPRVDPTPAAADAGAIVGGAASLQD